MGSIVGDTGAGSNVDYPVPGTGSNPKNKKKAKETDENALPMKIDKSAEKSITHPQAEDKPSRKRTLKPIIKNEGKAATSPATKKSVRMQESVMHRQMFGAEARHERYTYRYKDQKLPLVDESTNTSLKPVSELSYHEAKELFEQRRSEIDAWMQLPPLKRPRGQHPVGERTDPKRTEKAFTNRKSSSITKASPFWREVDLHPLLHQALTSLLRKGIEPTSHDIKMEMVMLARENLVATDVWTLQELKDLFYSLFIDQLYQATEEHPGTPPDAIDALNLAEETILSSVMSKVNDIVSIERNEDSTFNVTYAKVSEQEIERFLRQQTKFS